MPLRPPPTQGKMTPASARPVNSGLSKELPPAPLGYGKGIWKNTSSIKCLIENGIHNKNQSPKELIHQICVARTAF